MIAREHVQMLRFKEGVFIVLCAIFISLLMYLSSWYTGAFDFYISLVLMSFGTGIVINLVKKATVLSLFHALVAAFTWNLGEFAVTGIDKVLTFFLVALIFEFIFLVMKMNLLEIPVDTVVGSIVSLTFLPLISAFILARNLLLSFPLELLNFVLLAFVTSLVASIVFFLLWLRIRRLKCIMKLETYLGLLH